MRTFADKNQRADHHLDFGRGVPEGESRHGMAAHSRDRLRRELGRVDFATAEARLRPDGPDKQQGPLSKSALREARAYQAKRPDAMAPHALTAIGNRLGLGQLHAWTDEALQGLAAWQRTQGLTVDGKFGPNSLKTMFPDGIPKAEVPPKATLSPRAVADARAFLATRAASLTPVLISRIGVVVGAGPAVTVSTELLQAVAAWQRRAGLSVDGKFGRRTAEAMFPGEEVVGQANTPEASPPQVRPAPTVLGSESLAAARAWYAARAAQFAPARLRALAAALPGDVAPVVDDAFIEAVAAWQKGAGLGVDGKLGPTSAQRLLPKESPASTAARPPKTVATDGGQKDQKALAIVSALEAGGRCGILNLWDKGIVSLGIRQVTLTSGNLDGLLGRYLDKARASAVGGALKPHQQRIEAFRANQGAIRSAIVANKLGHEVMGSGRATHVADRVALIDGIVGAGWVQAFRMAGDERAMQEAQHDEMETELLDKLGGRRDAEGAGLESTVGLAMAAHSLNGGVGFDRAIRGAGLDGLKGRLLGVQSAQEVAQLTAACATSLNGTKLGRGKLPRAAGHLDVLNNQWMLGTGGWGTRTNQATHLVGAPDAATRAKVAEAISIATWATMMFGFFYTHQGTANHEFKAYLKLAATDLDLVGDGKRAIVHGVGIETGR